MKRPDISFDVMVPAYNHEKFISQCIDSILGQTYKNFTLWIVDDNSTDGTASVVESYRDSRIRFVRNAYNKGVNASINELMAMSNGDCVCGIGSDDFLAPDYLSSMAELLSENPDVGVVYCDLRIVDAEGRSKGNEVRTHPHLSRYEILHDIFIGWTPILSPGRCIRRSLVDKVYPLTPAFLQAQDVEESFRLLMESELAILRRPLVSYRVFGGNISTESLCQQACYECESARLMDLWLTIGSDSMLQHIFCAETKEIGKSFGEVDRRYLLGRIALKSKLEHKRRWGYQVLLGLIAAEGVDSCHKMFDFNYRTLREWAGLIADPNKDYRKKCKMWRKRYQGLLIVTCLLALLFILCVVA